MGQVSTGGGALPSVRVDVNPAQLANYGLSMANVQSTLSLQNADVPRARLPMATLQRISLQTTRFRADDYKPLIIGYNNGAAVRLSDVASVTDSVQNIRTGGYLNGKRAIVVIIFRQPGANIIQTVDRLRAELDSIKASIPSGIDMTVVLDRTTTIRASVNDVERTLILSIVLVIVVVFVFLRNGTCPLSFLLSPCRSRCSGRVQSCIFAATASTTSP